MKINEVYLQKLDCGIRDRVRDYIKSNDKDQCDLINLINFVYDTGCADGYSDGQFDLADDVEDWDD